MAKYLTCCGCDEVNFYHSAVCCNARAGLQSHNPLGGLQPNSYVRSSTFPCSDWLVDLANTKVEYIMALKELWRVTKASWNMGYSPEFTKAYQRLMELDRENEKKTE
jgi:hypothetical protein